MVDFNSFVSNLNSLGFYDFVLPWILFLVIFYALLESAPFLQQNSKKKKIVVIISAILAFFVVNTPVNNIPLGRMLSNFFGWTSIYIAGILVVLLFLGMGGKGVDDLGGGKTIAIILTVLAILVLGNSGFPMLNIDSGTWTLLFVLALVGGALLFLGDEEGNPGNNDAGKS